MRLTLLLLIALLASCGRNYGPACEQSLSLPPITPDYCNVTMPCNMAAPSFTVEGATHLRAEVECGSATLTIDGEEGINLGEALELALSQAADKSFNAVKRSDNGVKRSNNTVKRSDDDVKRPDGCLLKVTLSLWNADHPNGISYAPFSITLSPDSIDRYLTYRLIPPGYEGWHSMGIYRRDLCSYDEQPLVTISEPQQGCVNCHTPAWGNAKRRLYHKRGEGGGTQFDIDGEQHFINLKELGLQGSYPAWHPSGRYVAFASTDTHQGFYHSSRDKIEVYDLGGQLFIYDTKERREITYPQLSTPGYWHTFPTFSLDGSTLYYCRAKAVDMPHQTDSLHYELMAVPFDSATAAIGEPTTLISKTDNSVCGEGRDKISISFPRVSPDGRFLMYTVADCGTFPIWHKEADLGIISLSPVGSGGAGVEALNSPDVDSYHSWSSNSRWVVFSSRRGDGRYTRLYFAHIDSLGKVTKPFPLPQASALHDQMLLDSYNVPEFMHE